MREFDASANANERRRPGHHGRSYVGPASGHPERSAASGTALLAASIVLPAYNEAAALPYVLGSLLRVLDDSCEVIVVDDGSTDDTAEIALRYPCRLLCHQENYGKGAAVRTGVRAARGRFIIVMDADHTYPAEVVPRMVALAEQYDLVRGVRQVDATNSPFMNRCGNKFFNSVLKVVHGLDGVDHLSGLYGLRRQAFDGMQLAATRFDLEIEIAVKEHAHGLKAVSFPIKYEPRIGPKKLRPWHDGWAILRQVLSMALIYNPALAFVLPGLLVWLLAASLTIVLGRGQLVASSGFRLDLNSFVVAALGATIGFQLIVFGVVAALFAIECGAQPKWWLSFISRRAARSWITVLGALLSLAGVGLLVQLVGSWILAGGGPFNDTRRIVFAGTIALWGMQITLAMLFITIFTERLERKGIAFTFEEVRRESLDSANAPGLSVVRLHGGCSLDDPAPSPCLFPPSEAPERDAGQ